MASTMHLWAILPYLIMYATFIAMAVWAIIAIFRLGTAYKRLANAREQAWRTSPGDGPDH